MDEEVLQHAASHKVEKKAAREQLRTTLSMLYDVAEVRPEDFKLPASWVVRPVARDEVRVCVDGRGKIASMEVGQSLDTRMNCLGMLIPPSCTFLLSTQTKVPSEGLDSLFVNRSASLT